MEYHHLDDFIAELEVLEGFFTEFAACEDEVLTFGMRKIAKWESYQNAAPGLKMFETKMHEFLAFLRPVDKGLHERVATLVSGSNLIESIVGVEVSLRIATQRKSLSFGAELTSSILFQLPYISNFIRRRKLFSEEVIPIQRLLVSIGRLISLVRVAKDTYIHQWSSDSDVFTPSNLENEKIIGYIEAAIDSVEANAFLPKDEKKQLKEYLSKAKSEFAQDRPSWNKIVGALVIAAAITSGIADSDGALANIDAAIKYILGTSVEKHIHNPVPLLNGPRQNNHESKAPEVVGV
ncbi:hypothetical protein [Thiohalomonas denitrificans]|uniref:Uncharacterized protein n=1 Tax=Thiohalomonas denitrificans TaxID=415747 RepID=A0A1G5PUU8_9GAMM|nr:hypothetical protein [Thiohalomonas denitrificans]SCZ53202.1 hypothetical protein SAMN03097708_00888 [Thiohalomonas denitrificans]